MMGLVLNEGLSRSLLLSTFVSEILARIEIHIKLSPEIEKQVEELEMDGFKGLDALHLAFAEAAKVDYIPDPH